MPDGGATSLLLAVLGRNRALSVSGTPRREALEIGIFARTWPRDTFVSESDALARRLAARATRAQAATKEAINRATLPVLDVALEVERDRQRELMSSANDDTDRLRLFDPCPPENPLYVSTNHADSGFCSQRRQSLR